MRKEEADATCEAIGHRSQRARVVRANLQYNRELVAAQTDYQKLVGGAIDLATAKVNNQTKYTQYLGAGVQLQSAETKLAQAEEKLTQEQTTLEGLESFTPLVKAEWEQKKLLKQSRIDDLKQAVYHASRQLDDGLREVASLAAG